MSSAILLSGGIDSIALTYWKRPQMAFTINYGQRCSEAEIRAATKVCAELKIKHEIIHVDCSKLGSGDLIGTPPSSNAPASEWWPFRNQLLITLAAMRGVEFGFKELMFGAVKSDSWHADGQPEFVNVINKLLNIQEGQMSISAPAINMSAVQLVKVSGIPFSILCWSHSCHTGNYACGSCRGCNKHRETMVELGYEDY